MDEKVLLQICLESLYSESFAQQNLPLYNTFRAGLKGVESVDSHDSLTQLAFDLVMKHKINYSLIEQSPIYFMTAILKSIYILQIWDNLSA